MAGISFEIKTKPLSLNNAYPTSKSGIRYLKKEGRDYKKLIALTAKTKAYRMKFEMIEWPQAVEVEIKVYLTSKMYKRRNDLDNYSKLIIDSLDKILMEDDAQVMSIKMSKVCNAPEDKIYVCVKTITNP